MLNWLPNERNIATYRYISTLLSKSETAKTSLAGVVLLILWPPARSTRHGVATASTKIDYRESMAPESPVSFLAQLMRATELSGGKI